MNISPIYFTPLLLLTILFTACISAVEVQNLPTPAVISGADKNHPKVIRAFSIWKEQFGDLPFDRTELFSALIHLMPQERTRFTPFTDQVLGGEVRRSHKRWIELFFKNGCRDSILVSRPSGYLINITDVQAPSLLMHEGRMMDFPIVLIENANVMFLQVGMGKTSEIQGAQMAQFLFDWIDAGYQSHEEIRTKFSLPDRLKLGSYFTNAPGSRVELINDWREIIVGFISRKGEVCLILFKAFKERQVKGFPHDVNWLNRNLFMADGETLVAPLLSTNKEMGK